MTERLDKFEAIDTMLADAKANPQHVLDSLLEGFPYSQVGRDDLRFGCSCSSERVLASLSTISPADLNEMIEANEILEVGCDYCGAQYKIAPDLLRGLLVNN